jgi:RNA polymerase sigma factor (sigma-70 family)
VTVARFVGGLRVVSRLRLDQREDVMQTVWLELVRHLPRLPGHETESDLQRWLVRVVRSKVADILCAENRGPRQSLPDRATELAGPEEEDPAIHWQRAEEWELLRAALEELRQEVGAENWRLLEGRHVQGSSVSELADEAELTAHEVSCRLCRMLAKLRARLVSEEEQCDAEVRSRTVGKLEKVRERFSSDQRFTM